MWNMHKITKFKLVNIQITKIYILPHICIEWICSLIWYKQEAYRKTYKSYNIWALIMYNKILKISEK